VKKVVPLTILALSLSGCSLVSTNYSKTGEATADALPKNCPVTVYTTHPKRDFQELGMVEIDVSFYGFVRPNINNISAIKEKASEFVCKAGGNAILLWEANGAGEYRKITVIKTL